MINSTDESFGITRLEGPNYSKQEKKRKKKKEEKKKKKKKKKTHTHTHTSSFQLFFYVENAKHG